jgi:hypothetical protein
MFQSLLILKESDIMGKREEYVIELSKKINTLKILEVQSNEIMSFINKNLTEGDIDKKNQNEYLNNILTAYGRNNYTSYIILNSIMNFLIFNVTYIIFLMFKNTTEFSFNGFIIFSIFLLTIVVYPILKIIIRSSLLSNIKGLKIVSKLSFVLISFFALNLITYRTNIFNDIQIVINKNIFLIIGIIAIILIQIILKMYKFDFIKTNKKS